MDTFALTIDIVAAVENPIPADLAFDAPPLTDDDLEAYFALEDAQEAGTADEATPVPEHPVGLFTITDLGLAEWAMRRKAAAEAEVAALAEQRDDWMRRIGEWFDQAARRPARTAAFMTERLEAFGLAERARNPKVATIPLPSGVIKTTASKPTAEVADDEAAAIHVQSQIEVELAMPTGDPERPTPWADAYRAAGIGSLDALVRWTPKVYAGPLRSLVTVAERKVGVRVTVTLACGHTITYQRPADDEGADDPVVGEFVECSVCEPDAIDGAKAWPVRDLADEDVMEPVVLGPDGEPIPGVVVRPGGTTAKASVK